MSKPPECEGCPLFIIGGNFIPPSGSGANGTLLLGEAPGREENEAGAPFVGPAGRLLNRLLAKARLAREDFAIANSIQCRPPDNELSGAPYEIGAINHCKVHRDAIVARFQPKRIVALGDIALRTLTGESGISQKRGYEYQSSYGIPVVGTFHPAFLMRERKRAKAAAGGRGGMFLIQAVLFDLKIAHTREPETPSLRPFIKAADFQDYASSAITSKWVAADIETPYSKQLSEEKADEDVSKTIDRISFSIGPSALLGPTGPRSTPHEAVSVPWIEPFISISKQILAAPNDKLFWNFDFDVPRLEDADCSVNGRIVDVMWLFHFLFPDLPRGLGNVAPFYTNVPEWKSQSQAQPEYYSAMDSYVTGRVYEGILKHLESRGMLQIADRHVTQLLQVLRRMGRRGVSIDPTELGHFQTELKESLERIQLQLNRLQPEALRSFHPKSGYKRTPKCTDGLVLREFDDSGIRWARPLPFLAGSQKQVLAYVRLKKHTLTEAGKLPSSTEERYIQVLLNRYRDPIYQAILDYRGVGKILSTYANWPTGADGKVHTKFTLAPATHRLSSIRPNIQNIPGNEDDPLAMRFRSIIKASPGCKLVRADYIGIEAVLTGFFAGDREYQKLALLGVHAFATAHWLKLAVPSTDSPNIRPFLKQVKETHGALYKKIKKAVHGINYGLGPEKLFSMNPGMFESRREAKQLHAFVKGLFKGVTAWQNRTVIQALTQNHLVNPFGYVRWFWDANEDGPAAIAQLPQSTAAAIIKEAMLILDTDPLCGPFMVWQIHDELIFDVPVALVEPVAARVRAAMERPIPELGGLVINVNIKIGDNLI